MMPFSPEGEDYVRIWRGFLSHLAGWDNAKIERLIARWAISLTKGYGDKNSTPSLLFHELALYWVTFEVVPPAERKVRSPVWREVNQELVDFSGWKDNDERLSSYAWQSYDWDALRRSLAGIFSRHGYPPLIDPAWPEYWIAHGRDD